jgi:hypothetical protein
MFTSKPLLPIEFRCELSEILPQRTREAEHRRDALRNRCFSRSLR